MDPGAGARGPARWCSRCTPTSGSRSTCSTSSARRAARPTRGLAGPGAADRVRRLAPGGDLPAARGQGARLHPGPRLRHARTTSRRSASTCSAIASSSPTAPTPKAWGRTRCCAGSSRRCRCHDARGGHARGPADRDHHPPPGARHRGRRILQRVPRPRGRVRRGARVSAGRRRPHHRLERDRPARRRLRQALSRGAGAVGALRGGPERVGRVRQPASAPRASSAPRWPPCSRSRRPATTTGSARSSSPTGSSITSRPPRAAATSSGSSATSSPSSPRGTGTDLARALAELEPTLRRRAVIFVLSDFLATGYETVLAPAGPAARRGRRSSWSIRASASCRRRASSRCGIPRPTSGADRDTGDARGARSTSADRAEAFDRELDADLLRERSADLLRLETGRALRRAAAHVLPAAGADAVALTARGTRATRVLVARLVLGAVRLAIGRARESHRHSASFGA